MPPTERLETLTPEQAAILPEIRDHWLRRCLATGPADRPAAEAGVRLAYQRGGLPAPRLLIWLDSPLQATYAIAMLWLLHSYFDEPIQGRAIRTKLGGMVKDPVWDQVWERIEPQRLGRIGDKVRVKVDQFPLQRAYVRSLHEIGASASVDVDAEVTNPVRARVWEQVGAQVQGRLADVVGPKVWAHVWPQVRDLLGGHVWSSDLAKDYGMIEYEDQVPAEVSLRLWHHEWEAPLNSHLGPYSAGYLARYHALARLGVPLDGELDGLGQVIGAAGWWWPFEDAAILTERPVALHLDAEGYLHNPDGPALVYPDGFAVHALRGTRVDGDQAS